MGNERAKSVLIVAADTIAAAAKGATLQEFGYSTLMAAGAEEALYLLKYAPSVDLVLMDTDAGVDGVDGIDAAMALQRERRVPVVFQSDSSDRGLLERMASVDSFGFVDKDASDEALAATIYIAFQRQSAERKAREDCLRKMLAAIPDIISINNPEAVYAF
ncbi:MAG: response regulator [Spirochaetes bacterium]|nr:response regulator [Spirochaetota bacterium]MBU1079883.1 response regulator [Spirochaetota bacterium]